MQEFKINCPQVTAMAALFFKLSLSFKTAGHIFCKQKLQTKMSLSFMSVVVLFILSVKKNLTLLFISNKQ
jgi:hypothetical protein